MKQALHRYGIYCASRMARNKGILQANALLGFFGIAGLRHYKGE